MASNPQNILEPERGFALYKRPRVDRHPINHFEVFTDNSEEYYHYR